MSGRRATCLATDPVRDGSGTAGLIVADPARGPCLPEAEVGEPAWRDPPSDAKRPFEEDEEDFELGEDAEAGDFEFDEDLDEGFDEDEDEDYDEDLDEDVDLDDNF